MSNTRCGSETVWDETVETAQGPIDDGLHIIPCFEFDPLHLAHRTCWCSPTLVGYDADGLEVWSHQMVQ